MKNCPFWWELAKLQSLTCPGKNYTPKISNSNTMHMAPFTFPFKILSLIAWQRFKTKKRESLLIPIFNFEKSYETPKKTNAKYFLEDF